VMARAAQGEEAAFSELYALTHRKMRKTARAVCAQSAELEDILQDSFVKIWRNAHHFNPERSSPISWMSVIVRNTAIDAVRLKKLPTTDLDHALLVPDPTRDEADGFDYDHARPIAANIISKLPADRRILLTLAYIEGESRQSLAKRFGVPVGTIKPGFAARWKQCGLTARRSSSARQHPRHRQSCALIKRENSGSRSTSSIKPNDLKI
jgi:RNA polymerase sigma-70 factor (ECF subfamily)